MMQLLGRLALSLCLLTAVAGEDEDLRLPNCRYVKTAGHLLYGRNTFELQNVRLSKCKRVCNQKQEQCRSFDYNRELKLCFLSDRTKTTDPEHFGDHPKFAYFERQCGNTRPSTTPTTTTTTTNTSTTTTRLFRLSSQLQTGLSSQLQLLLHNHKLMEILHGQKHE